MKLIIVPNADKKISALGNLFINSTSGVHNIIKKNKKVRYANYG